MYAKFWKRAAALIIDFVIFFVIPSYLFSIVVGALDGSWQNKDLLGGFILAGILLLFHLFYLILFVILIIVPPIFESSGWQGTPGKKIFGIKICNLNGHRLSFWRALFRNFVKIFSVRSIIGAVVAAFTRNKQSLHDIISDTVVIDGSADVSNLQVPRASSANKIFMAAAIMVLFFAVPIFSTSNKNAGYSHGQTNQYLKKRDTEIKEKNDKEMQQFINTLPSPPVVDNTVQRTDQEILDLTRKIVANLAKTMDDSEYGPPNLFLNYANIEISNERTSFKINATFSKRDYSVTVIKNQYINGGPALSTTVALHSFIRGMRECCGMDGTEQETAALCGLLDPGSQFRYKDIYC